MPRKATPAPKPQTARRNHGRGHSYLLDGAKVSGVTTLLSGGLPKPALVDWAARTVAGYAVDRWDELGERPVSERLRELERAHRAERDAAAVRGSRVHALADPLSRGDEVDVPDELAGHVEACVRFLDDWAVEPIAVERPVFSRRHRYGGTFDLVADLGDGHRWLLDWKTNKSGPFGDTAFQLAAYRYAEFYLDDDGAEVPMPPIDQCGVVWLRADGYELYPYEANAMVFREFLYIAQVSQAATRARDYRGEALPAPVAA
jgi:hypothetical protein